MSQRNSDQQGHAQWDYDLVVIGAGSGGVRAARMAASYGAKVAVIEERYLGGTCVNVGCVPKKLFTYAAHYSEDFIDARGFGWDSNLPAFDWPTLRDRKTAEIERLNGIYRNILKNAGVTLYEGRGTIAGTHQVNVGDQSLSARYILIATGGWPFVPDIPGKEHCITSNEAFYLDSFPRRVAVVGGGYIGVEFAGIFHGLGAETHLIHRGEKVLRGFDEDLRSGLDAAMAEKGINLRLRAEVQAVEKTDSGLCALLSDGSKVEVDTILFATGRQPNTGGLGLENTAVRLADNGAICVDDTFATDEPSIYALGDVIDRVPLTPVALAEGMALAKTLFKNQPSTADYDTIPTAVFSQPNIGTVGLSEAQAREQYPDDVTIFRTQFRHMKHTLSGREEKVLMKLVVQTSTDIVLGCHMLGPEAGEIIQGFAVALKCGATKAQFDSTVGIHPTAAEEFVTMREPVKN